MSAEEAQTFVVRLGAEIRRRREQLGVTQEDLASYLGVKQATVSSWETGRAVMGVDTERRILAFLAGRERAQKAVTA